MYSRSKITMCSKITAWVMRAAFLLIVALLSPSFSHQAMSKQTIQLAENQIPSTAEKITGRSLKALRAGQQQAAQTTLSQPEAVKTQSSLSIWQQMQHWLRKKQAEISRTFSNYLDQYKKTNNTYFTLALILASLAYGLVHAAGPGHGKVIVSSYVLANNQTMRRGILLAFLSAFAQGTIAVILVGGLVFLFQATGTTIKTFGLHLTQLSYLLIIALGGYLFLSALYRRYVKHKTQQAPAHNHNHQHKAGEEDCGCDHAHLPASSELQGEWNTAKVISLVLSVGLRPCTGALYVLAFALLKDVFWVGALAVYAMALGTAITISLMTMAVVGGRNLALVSSGKNSQLTNVIYDICTLGGALIIMAFGVLLFSSSLGPISPF